MKKKGWKIAMIVILVVVLLACGLLAAVGNLLFDFALNPNGRYTMKDLYAADSVEGIDWSGESIEQTEDVLAWWDYCSEAVSWYEKEKVAVTLDSGDGIMLHGWEFVQEGHRYAIVCHGYTGVPSEMAAYAMKFYDMGFSVLTPAAVGHELSGGKYYGMGWPERKHMLEWIARIIETDPQAEICLFGVSMGGATVMMTAGEELPEQVKCIIEDCGYSSVWDEFGMQLEAMFHMPEFPLLHIANLVARIRAGYDFREASAVEQLKKAEVPMMFIHGETDIFVPYEMLDIVYEACASEKKVKLSIPDASHAASVHADPMRYWTEVERFIAEAF